MLSTKWISVVSIFSYDSFRQLFGSFYSVFPSSHLNLIVFNDFLADLQRHNSGLSRRFQILIRFLTSGFVECERRRQTSENLGLIKNSFVPSCAPNGDFLPLQCELGGQHCFCVDRNGLEIPNSRANNSVKPNCARKNSKFYLPIQYFYAVSVTQTI